MKHEITAKRLRQAMDRADISAADLSRKANVGEASISQYLSGLHAPSNLTAGRLANVLEVSPVWLQGFDVPMTEKVVLELDGFTPAQIERIKEYAEFIKGRDLK